MKVDTYKCDVCNVQKQTSNHWWLLRLVPDQNSSEPLGANILRWDADDPLNSDFEHICGADCVTQWLSKNLL
jgi:hypothetical protein